MRPVVFVIFIFISGFAYAQQKSGTIKIRKAKSVKGIYVLEESDYYKSKLYVRLFDNNAAIFLRAAVNAAEANDSTAKLLYTYRKNPSVYKLINDSLFIEGSENKVPFLYRGLIVGNRLKVQKINASQTSRLVFKKVL